MFTKHFRLQCLFFFCLLCISADDPTKYDYCHFHLSQILGCNKTKIVDQGAHAACECQHLPGRVEVKANDSEKLTAFRQFVLDIHNKLRNDFAGGKEVNSGFMYAADMMALNYDLTLEFFARCRAMASLFLYSDRITYGTCRVMPDGTLYGQNAYASVDEVKTEGSIEKAIMTWYDEYKHIEDKSIIDSYNITIPTTVEKLHAHFAELVWSRITTVGCVLVYLSTAKLKNALVCDYHGGDWGANVLGWPMYKRVDSLNKTCTKCYQGKKCDKNSKYPYLCGGGEIKPAPNDPPFVKKVSITGSCFKNQADNVVTFTMLFVIIVFL